MQARISMCGVLVIGLFGLSTPGHAAICDTYSYCTGLELYVDAAASGSGLPSIPPVVYDVESVGTTATTQQSLSSQSDNLTAFASNLWAYDDPNCCSFVFAQYATINATATADYGSLGAEVGVSSIVQAGSYSIVPPPTNAPSYFVNPNGAGGFGTATVYYADTITVLKDGTEIFTFDLEMPR